MHVRWGGLKLFPARPQGHIAEPKLNVPGPGTSGVATAHLSASPGPGAGLGQFISMPPNGVTDTGERGPAARTQEAAPSVRLGSCQSG